MRLLAVSDQSEELLSRLKIVEEEVRVNTRMDAIKWCKRSRVRWLSLGEAPTRYLFAQFKARRSRETLRNIRIDEDTCTLTELETRH